MNKKDLECAICLSRFNQPKTLKCMHTYCLQCIQKWVETHGKMKCPICGQEHDLTKEDLKKLASNTMISQLLEYVMKTEDQKPTNCSFCDNQPAYHCSTCQLYLCGAQCVKQHKAVPLTKDHPLYTLDKKEQDGKQINCQVHCNTPLEFYCSNCNKSACKKCEHILRCYQKQHKVIPMSTAVEKFNKDANDIVELAHKIEKTLTEKQETLTKDRSEFDSQLMLCRTAIKIQEKKLLRKVQEKSKELLIDLEIIYKKKKENFDSEVNDIDSKITQIKNLIVSTNTMMNKPEEIKTLLSHKTTVKAVKDKVLGTDFDQSLQMRTITPNFIPSVQLDELMNTEGIGRITIVDSLTYKVAEDDEHITVTKGQPFVVKVSSLTECDACQLAATLINFSSEESPTKVEYDENGHYKITGRCNVEGDWQMKITAGGVDIKGSPVNIKVEKLGLVHIIDNISDYGEHIEVADVISDTDGYILVSTLSTDILKFNQSGSFVAKIQAPQDFQVNGMHQLGDGHVIFTDQLGKCVVMCDDKFQEIHSFGKEILKCPQGLAVNKETRVLYVADCHADCVFKFNVDDGTLLGKIGSEGSEGGQMNEPQDVTLTKEGHVIISDFGNKIIQIFNTSDELIKFFVCCGGKYDYIVSPTAVLMDMDENIMVSSHEKLQLFDKNGVFIKRIDHEDDGLCLPSGISIISKRPRRVAVADHGSNNVKIFNY
ncbi:tripartite motif-containing protein 2-like [Anneissia japonica]|uniref:tripartite motif-containing protein 2-like n=1 Tax=Anneissia japonica TaxID=1529436 RepID=UPI001425AC68|nr:tripartite motif-containing protein 2-like [Anneissia japonica]